MLESLSEVSMTTAMLLETTHLLRRRGESEGGCGPVGCFILLLGLGLVLYLVFKGRRDRREQLGASTSPMGSGPIAQHAFANPFPKCPNCGAAGDKMKQQWDGLRKVTWSCGYCGHTQVQELQDHELPQVARQRLGLDPQPGQNFQQGGQPYGNGGGSGMGGLLTGMMIGSMMGGSSHHHRDDGWSGDSNSGSSDWGSGDSGGSSDWGDSGGDSGGDWGDSGGDSGGSDW